MAAEIAVDTPKSYFEEVITEYEKRRDISFERLSKIEGVIVPKPEGAFYMVIGLPIEDAEHFAKWMLSDFRLNNETLMIAPAEGFYGTKGLGKNQIRIAYVLNEKALNKSFDILEAALKEYKNN